MYLDNIKCDVIIKITASLNTISALYLILTSITLYAK